MEQVRFRPAPRESSPTDPAEWLITEDGYSFGVGDRVFNYYDSVWVTVVEDPTSRPYPDGWFEARDDQGAIHILNSVRVAAQEPRR